MSAHGHADRSRQWLGEQLELLGNLRNANPRDPSFKLWRQNTLTVLQRIWHGDQARSERFRRIAFSPASQRSDPRTTREWYVRGCTEATELLRAMLTEVDAIGVPDPVNVATAPPILAGGHEDDFPVLELPSTGAPAQPASGETDMVVLDAGGTAAALAPHEGGHPAHEAGAPAPPTLRIEPAPPAAPVPTVPESAPPKLPERNERSRPAPVAGPGSLPAMPVAGPPSAASPRAPRAPHTPAAGSRLGTRRSGPTERRSPRKPPRAATASRLADMLGLGNVGRENAAGPAAAAPPHVPVVPGSATPVASAPPPPPPVTPPPVAPAEIAVAPVAPVAPPAEELPPVRVEPPAGEPTEGEDLAQVTADFMRNSPVLGLQGRPVQRASDATQFTDPDAVALATLAADIGRHVSDEAAREPLRAALFEFAAQIEAQAPEWSAVRDLVAAAMAHPELARRLMPLVLPWLGRAA